MGQKNQVGVGIIKISDINLSDYEFAPKTKLPFRRGTWRVTELGLEKRCGKCFDFWPADTEFYYRHEDGLHSYCKACVEQRCRELRGGLTGWEYYKTTR